MNGTPQEFCAALARAFGAGCVRLPDAVEVAENGVCLRFAFHAAPDRVLGALSLPMMRIDIEILAGSEAAAAALLARIDRATLRGGG